MAQQKEPSEYDEEETTYRTKSARAKFCDLGLDVLGGLLKALPPVAMTNLAIIVALNQWLNNIAPGDDTSDVKRLIDIAVMTFLFFLAATLASMVMVWQLTPRLVKNTRHAEWSDIRVRAIKMHALSALGDYLGDMPRIQLTALRPALLNDSGKMDMQWVRPNWRLQPKVPEKMQRNLGDLYPNLVRRMDELPPMVAEYNRAFDLYSERFQSIYNSKWGTKSTPQLQRIDDLAKGRIIGSFLCLSGEIHSVLDLEGGNPNIVVDEPTELFLREFFNGDSGDPNDVASMGLHPDLKELAQNARISWENAHYKWMEIQGLVREIRQRGV